MNREQMARYEAAALLQHLSPDPEEAAKVLILALELVTTWVARPVSVPRGPNVIDLRPRQTSPENAA